MRSDAGAVLASWATLSRIVELLRMLGDDRVVTQGIQAVNETAFVIRDLARQAGVDLPRYCDGDGTPLPQDAAGALRELPGRIDRLADQVGLVGRLKAIRDEAARRLIVDDVIGMIG